MSDSFWPLWGTFLFTHANNVYKANYITPDKQETVKTKESASACLVFISLCFISSVLMSAIKNYFVSYTASCLKIHKATLIAQVSVVVTDDFN